VSATFIISIVKHDRNFPCTRFCYRASFN